MYAAVMKLASMETFQATMAAHGVVPESFVAVLSWLVPAAECVCAVGILTRTGHRGWRGIAGCLCGLGLLAGFAVYVTQVPSPVLEASGCGCMGGTVERWVGGITGSARIASMAVIAVFAGAHVALASGARRGFPDRSDHGCDTAQA